MAEFSGASNYPEEFYRRSCLDSSLLQDLLEREIQRGLWNSCDTQSTWEKTGQNEKKVAEAGLETIEFSLGNNTVSLNCNADSDEIRYSIINVLQALSKAELIEFCQALSQATLAKGGVK